MPPPRVLPLIPSPVWVLLDRETVPAKPGSGGTGAATPGTGGPKWTEAGLKKAIAGTKRGREILKNLPASTKWASFERKAGESRLAYYDPNTDTIYVPSSLTDTEAASLAAHEAVHADQTQNDKRPKDDNDQIEMEVEAKHAGLDVYEQLGSPTPHPHKGESLYRKIDRKVYEERVRETYKKQYGIK